LAVDGVFPSIRDLLTTEHIASVAPVG
jgi:hypothetical protein